MKTPPPTYTLYMSVLPLMGDEFEARIQYHSEGRFLRASRTSPAEYPTVHIDCVSDAETGTERTDAFFSPKEWSRIESAAENDFGNSQYDPQWDGPEEE